MKIALICLIIAMMPSAAAMQQDKKEASKTVVAAGEDCGCEIKLPDDTIALVNGVKISTAEVEARIKETVDKLRQRVVDARRQELDLQINSILLETEAKKRGITSTQLLTKEVVEKVAEPAETEIREFYDKNRDNVQVPYEQAKISIIDYLKRQRQASLAKKLADDLRAQAKIEIFVQEAPVPHSDSDRTKVLAAVNDRRITSGDIEESLKSLIFQVQDQIYAARMNEIDLRINDVLLQQEAAKRSVTQQGLLQDEVTKRVKTPSESDARGFYDQNKERISGEFDQVKAQIISYLENEQRRRAEEEFAGDLRKAARIQILLTSPESPVFDISTEGQPSKGPADASLTLIAFTDFECPACAALHPVIDQLSAEFSDRLRVVVRDFPLQMHRNAIKAALAAEAAREQGKYWEYAALLFRNQKELSVDKLKGYADRLSLDRKTFDAALDSDKYAPLVQRDMMDGLNLGIISTPTIYLNGKRLDGRSYEELKAAITAALKDGQKK